MDGAPLFEPERRVSGGSEGPAPRAPRGIFGQRKTGPNGYTGTRDRVAHYFDSAATKVWDDLTSDAPVTGIRRTVRAGRDRMRGVMLDRLPADLRGARVLDAGCGTGAKAAALAARGAEVVAVDMSPNLLAIARGRLEPALQSLVAFHAGDMFDAGLGRFDAVVAQDSMIYYGAGELAERLNALAPRAGRIVFSLAPRTPLLMAMFWAGKAFPRADRSPAMVPHSAAALRPRLAGRLEEVERVTSGFYISTAWELRG